jgi:C-8 sterol isomerase
VITGEMTIYTEERPLVPIVHAPGSQAVLPRRTTKGWQIGAGTWMLEYGRGLLPTALPVALGDAVFSAMDRVTLQRTLEIYSRLTFRELLQGKL